MLCFKLKQQSEWLTTATIPPFMSLEQIPLFLMWHLHTSWGNSLRATWTAGLCALAFLSHWQASATRLNSPTRPYVNSLPEPGGYWCHGGITEQVWWVQTQGHWTRGCLCSGLSLESQSKDYKDFQKETRQQQRISLPAFNNTAANPTPSSYKPVKRSSDMFISQHASLYPSLLSYLRLHWLCTRMRKNE